MAGTGTAHLRDDDDIVLRVEDLVVEFPASRGRVVHAVSGISLDLRRGETLGVVGESGCGKSTTGKAIMQLPAPTSGTVRFMGRDLTSLSNAELRAVRRKMQMIFQDPISSLNPRRKVIDIVADPLVVWGEKTGAAGKAFEVLESVGLDPELAADRLPHQFSGGQCQRISIARALIVDPEVIICDEPVSALDVSVQAQILNLLEDMKKRYGLTLVFIAHDLAVVRNISDRVAVLYLGKMCEVGPSAELYENPRHPYTRLLLDSIPQMSDVEVPPVEKSEMPSPINPPSGCRFRTRCPYAQEICASEEPKIREMSDGHYVACHFPLSVEPMPLDAPATDAAVMS